MDYENLRLSVMPTARDLSLLQSLYDNTLLSFSQIVKFHFTERSKPTVINRLTKLESAGLITRLKVPRLEVTNSKKMISVIYQITRFGISVVQKRHSEFELRSEPVRLRPYSIDHDLLLVEVMAALKIEFLGFKIVHGELFHSLANTSGLKPDAVLIDPIKNQKIAVELELTAKSEKRYRELMLKYRLSKDFSKVIYITSQRQIESKIKSVLGSGFMNSRFEFLTLDDVLKTKSDRPINNLAEPKAQEGGLL